MRLHEVLIVWLLQAAGVPENHLPTMLCIAFHESRYDPTAVNENTNGSRDIGLFQINARLWSEECQATEQDLYDPGVNTKCAAYVLKVQGLRAWYGYIRNENDCDNTRKWKQRFHESR